MSGVSRMGRDYFETAVEERMAHKLAEAFSKLLMAGLVDPYGVRIYPARGYWTHAHQDVQKFTGVFRDPANANLEYTFGSWWATLSTLDRKGFVISDDRKNERADNNFDINILKKVA